MSTKDSRVDKLFPALTAKERAILSIRALKEERDEDPKVRSTMPGDQVDEFNRYIALFNAVNQDIGFYIILLQQLVEQLDLRYSWLLTVRLWGMRASSEASYLVLYTKEPVTESEFQRHLKKARDKMVPVSEAAEVLTDRHDAWQEADLEEYKGESVVSNAAWERVFKEKKKEIVGLVDSGVLAGRRRGRSVRVNAGSFYDWLGGLSPSRWTGGWATRSFRTIRRRK